MHPKLLVLLIILPTTSGFVDCRTACRTCRELKAEQSLLEVHCAMCEECKQRRRERLQMKGQQTVKSQLMTRQAPPQVKAQAPIEYLQPQYPAGCPTPAPCPRSQEDYRPGQVHVNLDGQTQTCPPADQCVSNNRVQYIHSVITTPQPPIQQAPLTTPQYVAPPIVMPAPLPPPLPLPIPMPPMPFQYQTVPTTPETTTREAPIFNLFPSLSSLSSQFFPPPTLPSVIPMPPPIPFPGPPPLPAAPPPMPYPPYYPGCYCMPFMASGCQCAPIHHRPDLGTAHDMFPFTTERETISTKEYFYAYVGVPREILKD